MTEDRSNRLGNVIVDRKARRSATTVEAQETARRSALYAKQLEQQGKIDYVPPRKEENE
jgi:hypothetical protein